MRGIGLGGLALTGMASVASPATAGEGDDQEGTPQTTSDPEPEFRCSYVDLSEFSGGDSAVVAFADGSIVSATDGYPDTLGSNGRVVSQITVGEQTFENPDTDCRPGEKTVTFTRRSVTVRRKEFVRDFGDAPPDYLVDVVLYFADGTAERRDSPVDPTATYRGSDENEGKTLVAFRLNHPAFYSSHFWTNPLVEEPTDLDRDGLTNSKEVLLRTDPLDTDTDDDGWSDLTEVNRDTDPRDPDSFP